MNLDELQSVRDRERQTDKPQQLRESFYEDVGSFVEQLRAERDRAADRHNSPYADEVMQLTDEVDAAKQLVEDIHERRIGKVVKAASLEAAELSPEVEGLTTEERDLFEQLVGDIERHRQTVLDVVDGEASESPTTQTETVRTPAADRSDVTAADVMGPDGQTDGTARSSGDTEQPDSDRLSPEATRETTDSTRESNRGEATEPDGEGPDRSENPREQDRKDPTPTDRRQPGDAGENHSTDGGQSTPSGTAGEADLSRPEDGTNGRSPGGGDGEESTQTRGDEIERERVLVTESVATFVGSDDRDYDLVADDVVTLPSTNADILVERDAARRL